MECRSNESVYIAKLYWWYLVWNNHWGKARSSFFKAYYRFNRIWIWFLLVSYSLSALASALSISCMESCFLRRAYWAFIASLSCFPSNSFIFVIDCLYYSKTKCARVTTILFSFYFYSKMPSLFSILTLVSSAF